MGCENININIIEETVSAAFEENALNVSIIQETIDVQPVEETIDAQVIEETLNIQLEAAVVEYTGPPLQWQHDTITLTALQISNKAVNLTHTPVSPNGVQFIIEAGNMQVQGISWDIVGSTLNWAGTDIDGLLEAGEVISVKYEFQ